MSDHEFCSVDIEDHVMTVTIRRPQVLNALHRPATVELSGIFDRYAEDDGLWVAILTAEGERAFCVGNDLKTPTDDTGRWELPSSGFGGLTRRHTLDKPLIAAVNGIAAGGGFELALACDVIVAAGHAEFALPEVRLGLAALEGGIHRLARSVGWHRAMSIVLTGRRVPALEGKSLGFVTEVVSGADLIETARGWATQIAGASPLAIRASKQAMREGLAEPSLMAAMARDYEAVGILLASEDFHEGPAAFLEKRPPIWSGR
jgi:enoyl-CoA hydratase/carnithine racemase